MIEHETADATLVLEVAHFGNHYILPQKGKFRSIGYDLTVPEDITIPAHSRFKIPLNIAINLPDGVEGKIEPRSGFELKGMEGYGTRKVPNYIFGVIPFFGKTITGIQYWDCDVLVGKIDPGYTDNINVIVKNNDKEFTIRRGTRIAQMTFYRVLSPEFEIVDKLSCESRGGGLGSSGTGRIIRRSAFAHEKAETPGEALQPPHASNPGKLIPFHEYYARLSPEKREEIDGTLMGQVFNSKP